MHILRQTSPYIDSHVDQTFVLVIPGSLSDERASGTLGKLLQDVALLNFLRVRVVLVSKSLFLPIKLWLQLRLERLTERKKR